MVRSQVASVEEIFHRHPYKEVSTEDMDAAKVLLEVRTKPVAQDFAGFKYPDVFIIIVDWAEIEDALIIKMNSSLLWTRLRWRWLKPECNTETCPSMPTLR